MLGQHFPSRLGTVKTSGTRKRIKSSWICRQATAKTRFASFVPARIPIAAPTKVEEVSAYNDGKRDSKVMQHAPIAPQVLLVPQFSQPVLVHDFLVPIHGEFSNLVSVGQG